MKILKSFVAVWLTLFVATLANCQVVNVPKSEPTVVAQAAASPRAACVLIRDSDATRFGCSGVCVAPSGVIFTAKHCSFGDHVVVAFRSLGELPATKIYTSPEVEGVVAFRITGTGKEPFPFVTVSTVAPVVGDRVRYGGFPGCLDFETYLEGAGVIAAGEAAASAGGGFNIVRNLGGPGMSGGPLCDARGRLIGLCHGGDQGRQFSQWISWRAVMAATTAINRNTARPAATPTSTPKDVNRPRLILFTADGCAACSAFLADAGAGRLGDRSQLNLVVVKNIGGHWYETTDTVYRRSPLATDFERQTRRQITQLPTFWVEGTPHVRTGYTSTESGRNGFCGWLQGVFKALSQLIGRILGVGPEPPAAPVVVGPTSPEEPLLGIAVGVVEAGDGAAPVAAAANWDLVAIHVVVKRLDLGVVKGLAVKVGLERSLGPVRRKIDAMFEGKDSRPQIGLIAERLDPSRFAAVVAAADIAPDPAHLIVLVRKRFTGPLALIAEKVEQIVTDHVPEGLPIDIVFERIAPDEFARINNAIQGGEPAPATLAPLPDPINDVPAPPTEPAEELPAASKFIRQPTSEGEPSLLSRIKGMAADAAESQIEQRLAPLEQKLHDKLSAIAADKLGVEGERNWWQKLAFAIGGSSVAGAAVTALKLRARAKAREKLGHLLGRDPTPPPTTTPHQPTETAA